MNNALFGSVSYEQFETLSKANIDAMVKSSQIFAKGCEDLSKQVFDMAQTNLERSVVAGQEMMKAKTLKDLADTQSDLVKKSFETMLHDGTKISETFVKVANDSAEPITSHVNDVVAKAQNGQA